MSRLTLRLPETLHHSLVEQAQAEGVSLNQFIVYSLTRMTTARDLDEQRRRFEGLRSRFSSEEAETGLREVLAARTPI